jgi:hydroxymethylpyrimidine pyrophosphatase-like HAD family hydrolase
MPFLALATDYDGTLASDGAVRAQTWSALERLRAAAWQVLLVTGRVLDDLRRVCGHLDRFDAVVAENGALLHLKIAPRDEVLAAAPPAALLDRLRDRGVQPLHRGTVVLGTHQRHARTALEVLRELKLDWQVVLNRDAAMLLPAGVTKQSGLAAALARLGLTLQDAVAVGDAENDEAMLAASGCAVAVANAIPALRERADLVTSGAAGEGVEELIGRLLAGPFRCSWSNDQELPRAGTASLQRRE